MSEDIIRWDVARPYYMRESYPGSRYWQSETVELESETFNAAKVNRELFESHKINAQSYKRRAAEIVLGVYAPKLKKPPSREELRKTFQVAAERLGKGA